MIRIERVKSVRLDICAFDDASVSPPELMPNVILRTDAGLSGGVYTLSLSGTDGALKVWQMQNPASTNSPLLIGGQTVTNGVGVTFLSGEDTDLYIEALSNTPSCLLPLRF